MELQCGNVKYNGYFSLA